jgi:hypothetical protein
MDEPQAAAEGTHSRNRRLHGKISGGRGLWAAVRRTSAARLFKLNVGLITGREVTCATVAKNCGPCDAESCRPWLREVWGFKNGASRS